MANRSKAYIAPLILQKIPGLPFRLIKDTYIYSDFKPLEPILYMELLGEKGIVDEDFIQNLYEYESIEDVFTIGENYLVVLHLSSDYNYEYLCFKRGNYSWYTAEAKMVIIEYLVANVHKRSLGLVDKIRSIFSRDPMLKRYYEDSLNVHLSDEAELGSKMDMEAETFDSTSYDNFERLLKTSEKSI